MEKMDKNEIYSMITNYFVEQFEIPREEITPQAHLFKDLGLDSIDALDMIGMLETKIDLDVNKEELEKIRTVQDVVDYVASKFGVQA